MFWPPAFMTPCDSNSSCDDFHVSRLAEACKRLWDMQTMGHRKCPKDPTTMIATPEI